MGQRGVLRTLESRDRDLVAFFCPGCKEVHAVKVCLGNPYSVGSSAAWQFNENWDAPTFAPSIKVEGVVPITDDEHARLMAGEKIEPKPRCCHSFVTDGKIQFLGDCTHALVGQTVPLEAF